MAVEKAPFKLYQRKTKRGVMFYVRYLLPDGSYTAGRSTGKPSRKAAEREAWKYIQTGAATATERTKLKDYADGFFAWDGEWAVSKRSAGKRLSREQCVRSQQVTDKHVIGRLGTLRLHEIDTRTVRRFRNAMFQDGYAGATVNKAIGCLRAILESAEEEHLLRALPRFERAGLNQDERGILTQDEAARLFNLEWPDMRCYVASLVAASTGFRLGEVLGLRHKDVLVGRLEIKGSWNAKLRVWQPGTKNGQPKRSVPVPPTVEESVRELMREHPEPGPDAYLFYSRKGTNWREHPIEHSKITRGFYEALTRLDPPITEAERTARRITFHSHRHFFNSLLVESRIPLQKIQRLTGHLSPAMTARYYHTDNLEDVAEVQRQAFKIVRADRAS
jgi:integrase